MTDNLANHMQTDHSQRLSAERRLFDHSQENALNLPIRHVRVYKVQHLRGYKVSFFRVRKRGVYKVLSFCSHKYSLFFKRSVDVLFRKCVAVRSHSFMVPKVGLYKGHLYF